MESQKTLDNKNLFKVADICQVQFVLAVGSLKLINRSHSQMLIVEDKLRGEDEISGTKSFNIDEFIWPHGITPPLHWVRKRRFRKRVNRRVSDFSQCITWRLW